MTVKELIERLQKMPQDVRVVGSRPNGHDEYEVEIVPFEVSKYYKDVDSEDTYNDCVVYVGPKYRHPN